MVEWRLAKSTLEIGKRTARDGHSQFDTGQFLGRGQFDSPRKAVEHGLAMAAEGADLIDVGGESTRPGATPVSLDAELARVAPIVEALAKRIGADLRGHVQGRGGPAVLEGRGASH